MKYLACATVIMLSTSLEASSVDLIECKREKTETRQFCYVKSNSFGPSIDIEGVGGLLKPDSEEYLYSLDLFSVFKKGAIEIDRGNAETELLDVSALRPVLNLSVNWNDTDQCRRNGLWKHEIKIQVGDNYVLDVDPGVAEYKIALADLFTGEYEPVSISHNSDLNVISIDGSVSIADINYDPELPLPFERIPSYCKMLVSDPQITFDPVAINTELNFIRELVLSKGSILAKSSVIHSNIVNNQDGAVCRAHNFGKSLKNAEGLFSDDRLMDLSFQSRNYLKSLLIEAKGLGAPQLTSISINDLLPFLDDSQAELNSKCGSPSDYKVNKARFVADDGTILNQQGYDNAESFEKELSNLNNLMKAAWALAKASLVGANANVEFEWLAEAKLYVHFE